MYLASGWRYTSWTKDAFGMTSMIGGLNKPFGPLSAPAKLRCEPTSTGILLLLRNIQF